MKAALLFLVALAAITVSAIGGHTHKTSSYYAGSSSSGYDSYSGYTQHHATTYSATHHAHPTSTSGIYSGQGDYATSYYSTMYPSGGTSGRGPSGHGPTSTGISSGGETGPTTSTQGSYSHHYTGSWATTHSSSTTDYGSSTFPTSSGGAAPPPAEYQSPPSPDDNLPPGTYMTLASGYHATTYSAYPAPGDSPGSKSSSSKSSKDSGVAHNFQGGRGRQPTLCAKICDSEYVQCAQDDGMVQEECRTASDSCRSLCLAPNGNRRTLYSTGA